MLPIRSLKTGIEKSEFDQVGPFQDAPVWPALSTGFTLTWPWSHLAAVYFLLDLNWMIRLALALPGTAVSLISLVFSPSPRLWNTSSPLEPSHPSRDQSDFQLPAAASLPENFLWLQNQALFWGRWSQLWVLLVGRFKRILEWFSRDPLITLITKVFAWNLLFPWLSPWKLYPGHAENEKRNIPETKTGCLWPSKPKREERQSNQIRRRPQKSGPQNPDRQEYSRELNMDIENSELTCCNFEHVPLLCWLTTVWAWFECPLIGWMMGSWLAPILANH